MSSQAYEDIRELTNMKPIVKRGKLLFHIKKTKKALVRGRWRVIERSEDFKTPEELGYQKKVNLQILEIREGVSEATLSKIQRFFLHDIEVSVARTKEAKYCYLKPIRPDKVAFVSFVPFYSYSVDLSDLNNPLFNIRTIKSRRISAKKAKELLEKGYKPYGRFGATLIPRA